MLIAVALAFSHERPGATFLLIPPTARASGMAYAFTAIADDASANYYNAAGLTSLNSPWVAMTYLGYLNHYYYEAMHYVYFSAAYPLNKQAWGFDLIYFTPGSTEVIDSNGTYIGRFHAWRMAPKISYARKLTDKISCSLGWKYIYLKYGHFDLFDMDGGICDHGGSSWAFDFDIMYRISRNFSLGAVLHNLGPRIKIKNDWGLPWLWPEESSPLPCVARLGVAYKPLVSDQLGITVSIDITDDAANFFAYTDTSFWEELKYEARVMSKSTGAEIIIYKLVIFRLGYFHSGDRNDEKGITLGAGLRFKGIALDIGIDEEIYYYADIHNRSISLSYQF